MPAQSGRAESTELGTWPDFVLHLSRSIQNIKSLVFSSLVLFCGGTEVLPQKRGW